MQDEPEINSPTSDDPETHARDAVEAMRARGTDRPDVERALISGAARHARFLERYGLLGSGTGSEAI